MTAFSSLKHFSLDDSASRALQDLCQRARSCAANRSALDDGDEVAFAALVALVVGHASCRAADVLAVDGVPDAPLDCTAMVFCILLLTTCPVIVRRLFFGVCSFGHLRSSLRPCRRSSLLAAITRLRPRDVARARRAPGRPVASWPVACCTRRLNCSRRSSHQLLLEVRPRRSSARDFHAALLITSPAASRTTVCTGSFAAASSKASRAISSVHAFHLVEHPAGLDLRDPVLDVALAFALPHFERLLRDRLVREHPDPDLAAALDVSASSHGAPPRSAGRSAARARVAFSPYSPKLTVLPRVGEPAVAAL